jgi:hypothetical protein
MTEDFPDQTTDEQQGSHYDYLFADESPLITEEDRASWPVLKDYEKAWFAPQGTAESATVESNKYDYLFEDTPDEPATLNFARQQSGDGGRQPTPETEEDALRILAGFIDRKILAIVESMVPEDASPQEVMLAIRNDAAIREELARYFLSKIHKNPLKVPYRVAVDSEKNPNHTGYPTIMYSRAYAALLALSMLDGTYNKSLSEAKGTRPEYDGEKKEYVTGQHQAAAEFLLFNRDQTIPQ